MSKGDRNRSASDKFRNAPYWDRLEERKKDDAAAMSILKPKLRLTNPKPCSCCGTPTIRETGVCHQCADTKP